MGKKIVGNTVIFLVMLGLILGFSALFGSENTLIGVTTITAVMMFLSKDFSLNPVSTMIKLICFNVLMGVITFFAAKYVWLGIPLNFIALFIIGYRFSYYLSAPSFMPFTLQYVFILCTPVTSAQLPKRLLALAFGAVLIVLTQVLFNKNKIYKQGNMVLARICSGIEKKIQLLEQNQSMEQTEKEIQSSIRRFRRFVYNKREQDFFFTNEGRIKLNLSLELEKINQAINELALQEDALNILNQQGFKEELLKSINIVRSCLEQDEKLNELDEIFQDVFDKYKEEENTSVFQVKMINALYYIKELLYELKDLDKKHYNIVNKMEEIPSNFRLTTIYKENFRSDSLKFSYAFRLALGITISAFIVDFFNIQEGRWIIYTVNSLTQPFYEKSKEKTKDRLIATVIGIAIIAIVFFFIKGSTARSLTIMVISYLFSYSTTYKYRMITATVSAVGAAALYGNAIVLSVDRIVFVIVGAIIAVILSKFVFPYKAEDARRDLVELYDNTILNQINLLKDLITKKKVANEAMKNEILRANMIEEQLLSNEGQDDDTNLLEYLEGQRSILMGIADLYRWIDQNNGVREFESEEKEKLDDLVGDKTEISYDEIETFLDHSGSKYSLNSKIAVIDYIEIAAQINKMKQMKGCSA